MIQLENIFDIIKNPEDETYMAALEITGGVKGVILGSLSTGVGEEK